MSAARETGRPLPRRQMQLVYSIGGRYYDHNFLRFSPIFGEKIGDFLKYQCYDQLFSKFSFVSSQKRQIFRNFFGENILKIITSVPGSTKENLFN
jgi:hypothetical protein